MSIHSVPGPSGHYPMNTSMPGSSDVVSSNGMRVLFIAMNLFRSKFTSAYRAGKLIKYLTRAGCTLNVVCADPPTPGSLGEDLEGIDYTLVPYRLPVTGFSVPARAVNRLLSYPEPQVWWNRSVLRRLAARTDWPRPDAVFVTTRPHANQLIGVRLAKDLGLPYVADLRDDWLTCSRIRWHTPMHVRSARRAERLMVEHATAVLLNTHTVHQRFAGRYPQWSTKLHTLTNGYDEDDFRCAEFAPPEHLRSKHLIVYAGDDYEGFMTGQLSALAQQMRSNGLSKTWSIATAGPWKWPPARFDDVWTHLGTLSYAQNAALLMQGNLLLLPMPPGEATPSGTVPLKAYSYLRSGRAIVYLGEPGSTPELLNRFQGTFCLEREAWPRLADWIAQRGQTFDRAFRRADAAQYSFSAITERLLVILRGVHTS